MNNILQNTPETTNIATLDERGLAAACRLMERRGCEIIERGWECAQGRFDIIAKDGEDTLIFTTVKVCEMSEAGFPEDDRSRANRRRLEQMAAHFLAESTYEETSIRFDAIVLLTLNDSKAFARWHKGFIGNC